MQKAKSGSPTKVTSYRITPANQKLITKAHGNLAAFLNVCVDKEVLRLKELKAKPVKKSAKEPKTKSLIKSKKVKAPKKK